MKRYDFKKMSVEEIEKTILELRTETEAIIKETEAIKKETEAIKKEGEARHQKQVDELEAMKKESEARHQKHVDELEAMKKEGEARHQKHVDELAVLKKEREAVERKLQSTMDGLGFNVGKTAEELFGNSIEKTMEIDGVKYYKMIRNFLVVNNIGEVLAEIDIILFNKKYISIIEVKHQAKLVDLDKLVQKTIPNFIKEGTKYKKYTILPFVAGMSFDNGVKEFAKQHHIGLLKYRGEHFKVI